jgi:predicted lysophospholipase L1 biosynthesis ABC-type transport system permease subunit
VFVVSRDLLDNRGERVVLVRGPDEEARELLAERGSRVTNTVAVGDIFDGTSFLSAKWSYATLTAFAVLLGTVTLVGQVLVLESRLRSRRVAHVLMRPMGLTRRQELGASLVEVGMPLACGIVLGSVIGYAVARLSLGRLDSLRTMQPPARLVVDVDVLLVAAGIVAIVTVLFGAIATMRAARDDAAEVMRFAER